MAVSYLHVPVNMWKNFSYNRKINAFSKFQFKDYFSNITTNFLAYKKYNDIIQENTNKFQKQYKNYEE